MTIRHARCSCGQLKIQTTGEPVRISICHCLDCQLRTGSVFGVQARFPKADTRVEGRTSQYVRIADSGKTITFQFCPDCGSTVLYQLQDFPDFIGVPVGAFADPGFPAPNVLVYESRRHPWVELAAP
jgi:hypothetical protein